MPKKLRYIIEEAAVQFLGRLLLHVKTRRISLGELCRQIKISRVTYYRWLNEKRIPADQVLRISSILKLTPDSELMGVGLNGPSELWRAALSPADFNPAGGDIRNRQIVGYAAVWLQCQLTRSPLQVAVELGRGEATNPTSRVRIFSSSGRNVAHVDVAIVAGRYLYQAYVHPVAGEPRRVFEGCADDTGLRFCLEFLRSFNLSPTGRVSGDFDQHLKREQQNHFHRHVPIRQHTPRR